MAIGVGSIIQYKHFQELYSQQVLNVMYYEVVAAVAVVNNLEPFAEQMFTKWQTQLKAVQNAVLTHVRGEIYEVNGPTYNVYAPSAPIPGARTGDAMPSQDAFSVQLLRASRVTRHGWKRIAGVSESDNVNGVVLGTTLPTIQLAAQTLWEANTVLTDPISPTRTMTLRPIIWGGNDPAFPLGRYSYVEDVATKTRISTQNTRKVGRGS